MSAAELTIVEPGREVAATAPSPPELLARAFAQNAAPEVLAKYMDLNERWQARQALQAFNGAMADAMAEMPIIDKNRSVSFESKKADGKVGYKHADLAEAVRIAKPILAKHGLFHRFRTTSVPGEPISVTCIISHRDGHFEENTLTAGRDDSGAKNAIQAIGSTLTYLARYTFFAAVGLAASEDDDGRASGNGGSTERLTEKQLDKLKAAIVQVGVPIGNVLAYAKVERIEAITQGHFDKVLGAVWRWRPAK